MKKVLLILCCFVLLTGCSKQKNDVSNNMDEVKVESSSEFPNDEVGENLEEVSDLVDSLKASKEVIENNEKFFKDNISFTDENLYSIWLESKEDSEFNLLHDFSTSGWCVELEFEEALKLDDVLYVNEVREGEMSNLHINYQILDGKLVLSDETHYINASGEIQNLETQQPEINDFRYSIRLLIKLSKDTNVTAINSVLYENKINVQAEKNEKKFGGLLHEFEDGYAWGKWYDSFGNGEYALINCAGNENKIVTKLSFDDVSYVGKYDKNSGLTLITTTSGIKKYINREGDVIFSSDNEEFKEMILEMFESGKVLLERNEKSFDKNVDYYGMLTLKPFSDGQKIITADSVWWIEKEFFEGDFYQCTDDGIFVFRSSWETYGGDRKYYLISEEPFRFINITTNGTSLESELNTLDFDMGNFLMLRSGGRMGDPHDILKLEEFGTSKEVFSILGENLYDVIYGPQSLDESGFIVGSIKSEYKNGSLDREYLDGLWYLDVSDWENPCGWRINCNYLEMIDLNRVKYDWSNLQSTYNNEFQYRFSDGVLLLNLNGMDGEKYYMIVDKFGSSVIEPTIGIGECALGNGRFLVKVNEKKQVLNTLGDIVFSQVMTPNGLSDITRIDTYQYGMAYVETYSEESGGWRGMINEDGQVMIDFNDLLQ